MRSERLATADLDYGDLSPDGGSGGCWQPGGARGSPIPDTKNLGGPKQKEALRVPLAWEPEPAGFLTLPSCLRGNNLIKY